MILLLLFGIVISIGNKSCVIVFFLLFESQQEYNSKQVRFLITKKRCLFSFFQFAGGVQLVDG